MSHQSAYDAYVFYAGTAVMGATGWFVTPRLVSTRVPLWIGLPAAALGTLCVVFALIFPLGLVASGIYSFEKAPTALGAIGLVAETGTEMATGGVVGILVSILWLVVRQIDNSRGRLNG